MTKYIISEYGENGVKIKAEGFESAEMIHKNNLCDRIKELTELNSKEGKKAVFEWK